MPANLSFSFDIGGERQLSRRLHGLLDAVGDLSPVWARIVREWGDTAALKFDTEGAHEGAERWAPLSAKYAAWKERHFPGKPILERTGALRRATTRPQTSTSPRRLEITIDVPYAIYHQSHLPRTKLPRRPFASLTARQKTRWVKYLREHIHRDI